MLSNVFILYKHICRVCAFVCEGEIRLPGVIYSSCTIVVNCVWFFDSSVVPSKNSYLLPTENPLRDSKRLNSKNKVMKRRNSSFQIYKENARINLGNQALWGNLQFYASLHLLLIEWPFLFIVGEPGNLYTKWKLLMVKKGSRYSVEKKLII